ncbi:protein sidekick-2-like [Pocillopora damicornis]|uniref:protein sidekick-2-like n=1 Tax=Pocillopora damicornis TaxID=46731 RepID=UPI000F5587FC|nr:protein sidekick-2-like [Pocillopora damicornis]
MSYDPFMLNDIFNFTWEPVEGRLNGILRGYKVRWKQVKSNKYYIRNINNSTTNSASNRRRRRSVSDIITEIRLTNLSLYTNYSFEVAAITVAVGKFSDKYYFMSQEGVPTAPPGNVRSYNTSSRSIFVSWTRPNKSEIHGVLKGYEISYTPADNANATRKVMLCHLNTSYELTRLRIFTLYNITVAAFTIKGIGNESQLLQVYTAEEAPQAPPENVTAVAVNGSSIRVSWGPVPKDKRNGIITRYRVQFGSRTLKNVTNGTRQVRETQNSVVIGDLEMFVTYSFRVQACTKIGRGNFSEPVNQTTTQTVPNIILKLYGTPSNSSINVTWKVIDKPFGLYTPDKYEINSCTVNDSCPSGSCLTNITSKNWHEFTNLRGGTTHKFKVGPIELSARDGTVLTYPEGNFSEQINVTTKEGAPTRSPFNVTAFPHSQSSIKITWDEVDPCHRNGKITGYNLEVYNSSEHRIRAIDFNDTTPREGIVKNLVFANYSVRVRAFTVAGYGPFSQLKNTTTHKPAPNFVPQILNVTATGNTTINVKWNCTGIPPSDFAGYSVWYNSTTYPEPKDVGRQPCETNLTGLKPFTDYIISVAARTTQPGNYSKGRSAKTLEGVPVKEPEVKVEILESSSVSITWNPIPERFRNGIIKGYRIEYHPEEENKTAVPKVNELNENFTFHILKSLRKFTTYTIKVAAYTKAGIGPLFIETFKTSDDCKSVD